VKQYQPSVSAFPYLPGFFHLSVEQRRREKPIMGSTSLPSFIQMSSTTHSSFSEKLITPQKKFQIGTPTTTARDTHTTISWSFPSPLCKALHKSVPLAASLSILLWSTPGRC